MSENFGKEKGNSKFFRPCNSISLFGNQGTRPGKSNTGPTRHDKLGDVQTYLQGCKTCVPNRDRALQAGVQYKTFGFMVAPKDNLILLRGLG